MFSFLSFQTLLVNRDPSEGQGAYNSGKGTNGRLNGSTPVAYVAVPTSNQHGGDLHADPRNPTELNGAVQHPQGDVRAFVWNRSPLACKKKLNLSFLLKIGFIVE